MLTTDVIRFADVRVQIDQKRFCKPNAIRWGNVPIFAERRGAARLFVAGSDAVSTSLAEPPANERGGSRNTLCRHWPCQIRRERDAECPLRR